MLIDPIFFYIFLITIFFLAAVLVIVVWTQILFFKKFSAVKKENLQLKSSLINEEAEILKNAREKGERIITSALKQAVQIENTAQMNQKEFSELLNKELNQVIKKYSDQLEENSRKALSSYQKSLSGQMEKNIKSSSDSAEDFERALLSSMEAEIEKQKTERLVRLSEQIFGVLQDASKEVLNRSLNLSAHEDLITEALEKAKRNGGL